jgi:nitroreductase
MTNALISPEQLLSKLQWRYATKKFDSSKKIPADVWEALENGLVLTPSSFGVQPWKFFVVKNPEIRQKLLEHSWKQAQVVDASHLVVFAIKKDINAADVDRMIETTANIRQVPLESLQGFSNVVKGFLDKPPYPLDLNEWSIRQVYIALGQFMTSAALLGIDTCPMEGFNPSQYDAILGLNDTDYRSVVVCPAGYRAEDDKYATLPKVRYAKEEVISYI